jgi:hypothetical protein
MTVAVIRAMHNIDTRHPKLPIPLYHAAHHPTTNTSQPSPSAPAKPSSSRVNHNHNHHHLLLRLLQPTVSRQAWTTCSSRSEIRSGQPCSNNGNVPINPFLQYRDIVHITSLSSWYGACLRGQATYLTVYITSHSAYGIASRFLLAGTMAKTVFHHHRRQHKASQPQSRGSCCRAFSLRLAMCSGGAGKYRQTCRASSSSSFCASSSCVRYQFSR